MLTLLWAPAKEASVPNLVAASYLTRANSLSLAAAYGTFPLAAGSFALLAGLGTSLVLPDPRTPVCDVVGTLSGQTVLLPQLRVRLS